MWNYQTEEYIPVENLQTEQDSPNSYRVTSLENLPKIKTVVENIKKIEPKEINQSARGFSFLNSIENLDTQEIIEYTNETGYYL